MRLSAPAPSLVQGGEPFVRKRIYFLASSWSAKLGCARHRENVFVFSAPRSEGGGPPEGWWRRHAAGTIFSDVRNALHCPRPFHHAAAQRGLPSPLRGAGCRKDRPYQETTRTRSNNSAFINDAGPPTTRPKRFLAAAGYSCARELRGSCRAGRESIACRAGE
jgi:hypothetical protein